MPITANLMEKEIRSKLIEKLRKIKDIALERTVLNTSAAFQPIEGSYPSLSFKEIKATTPIAEIGQILLASHIDDGYYYFALPSVGDDIQVIYVFTQKGKEVLFHYHPDCIEYMSILKGRLKITTIREGGYKSSKEYNANTGKEIIIPNNVVHSIDSLEETVLITIIKPV